MSDKQILLGDQAVIEELDDGTVVIRSTGDNAINIQLSPSGRAYLQDNTTETTISAADTWTQIAGDWQTAHLNHISHDGSGGLVYDGSVTAQIQYVVFVSLTAPTNMESFDIGIFKNGTLKSRTPIRVDVPRADEYSVGGFAGFTDDTQTNDVHDIRVKNLNSDANVTVRDASFVVRG